MQPVRPVGLVVMPRRHLMLTFIRAAGWSLLRTALAALVPFLPALTSDPAAIWEAAALTVSLAVVIAVATSAAAAPDPTAHTWWELALIRALRQAGQTVAGAAASASLLTDVPWSTVLPTALGAAATTLVLAAITALPSTVAHASQVDDGAAVPTTVPSDVLPVLVDDVEPAATDAAPIPPLTTAPGVPSSTADATASA